MFSVLNNKRIFHYTPAFANGLLQIGVISQIVQMVSKQASADQSLLGWILVDVALIGWINWYRLFAPKEKIAVWSTIVGFVMNLLGTATVLWYRM